MDKVEGITDSNSLYLELRRRLRKVKFSIQCKLETESEEWGSSRIDLILKNLDGGQLKNLNLRLHLMDTCNLVVSNMSKIALFAGTRGESSV
jgi:hypothetical protein